ncbi:variant leucine-rich repeat-containing protein [Oerskovia gallyi]|uniref:Thioredoxin domain-containing protein n=1 Tax=Oerskovia gallyi TaxID=2762226 RepID=A0ABR8V3P6_9CELL|nr:thioredoxin domain-containing protein [Oerskovia gallyi]MBD7999383.1 thioredoxin domain-containing protein [Oerskovia gallyi]
MLHDEALRAVQDPAAPASVLAQVAAEHPDLRPRVAAHPGAYPDLLSWLAAWGDPAVDAALAARAQEGADAPRFASPYAPRPAATAYPTAPRPAATYPTATHPAAMYPGGAPYAVGPQVAAAHGPQPSAQRRARVTLLAVLAGLVLVLLVALVVFLATTGGTPSAAPAAPAEPGRSASPGTSPAPDDQGSASDAPADATPDHGLLAGAGDPAAPVTIEVYVDYMCPICGQFEEINGPGLTALREGGSARVVVHPVAILDRYSQGSRYSTRAAASAALVADRAPDAFQDFHAGLLAGQPEEGTAGLSDGQIADVARAAGVPEDVVAEIADGSASQFASWVAAATGTATGDPALAGPRGFGTPTIVIDGERWEGDWTDPQALTQAVEGESV